jgi:uncharacterized protein (DUF1501 family)
MANVRTNPMNLSRRQFLRLAGMAAATELFPWSWTEALATGNEDYKALVCVFLSGGNDGNNMIVPYDIDTYAGYSSVRAALALPRSSLLQVSPPSQGGRSFGLHPALHNLLPLWQQGRMAVQCNIGTLVAPITVTDYKNNRLLRPNSLFSHADQQYQWQTAESIQTSRTGWGGRIADHVASAAGIINVPMVLSLAGTSAFGRGAATSSLSLPASGSFGLSGPVSVTNSAALKTLLTLDRGNSLTDALSDVTQEATRSSALINPILTTPVSASMAGFNGLTSSIAKQLLAVARLIEARGTLGIKRQIFFVSQGSYDTHSNQLVVQNNLLSDLGSALAAFYGATQALGIADKVTAFTASDFARALRTSSGSGTDHAWGNHQIIIGDSVKGGDFYGKFPTLVLNGPDDVDGSGRWVPTASVDQYAATFASWFGVTASDLPLVLPHLASFQSSNLGFLIL